MHILVAFDKFKDCMSAQEACLTAQEVILKLHPSWTVSIAPITDGGEGFCEILTRSAFGKLERVPVLGPQLDPQTARIGYVEISNLGKSARDILKLPTEGLLAVIEMAQASGLQDVPVGKRDPWIASSYGTGQLIAVVAKFDHPDNGHTLPISRADVDFNDVEQAIDGWQNWARITDSTVSLAAIRRRLSGTFEIADQDRAAQLLDTNDAGGE